MASGFGFIDGKEKYNLLEFEKYANEFKKKYFNVKNPRVRKPSVLFLAMIFNILSMIVEIFHLY